MASDERLTNALHTPGMEAPNTSSLPNRETGRAVGRQSSSPWHQGRSRASINPHRLRDRKKIFFGSRTGNEPSTLHAIDLCSPPRQVAFPSWRRLPVAADLSR